MAKIMDRIYTLRPITAEDMDFLYEVYASTRLEELAAVDWSAERKADFLHMQFDAQHRYYLENYRQASFQVIEVDGHPAGRLYVDRRAAEIRIVDIALLTDYRRQGLGTAILGEILAEGEQRRLPVTIHVERFNPALMLYHRLGFSLVEDKGVYLLMEWTPPDQKK
jgi:GNAT superfamily N-acetyltransferase